ncbi:substrate-binding periplasmic protein [Roseibium sediminicola]|uniref:Transporter substrate-binding domain-containing protein n=1 Tax=Roseibium sediminicola TaxID=2933272 RepID=A0ABT0GZA3_9HYPH|nr:transporter substrate-binding domain-containing protein [Roseibium sp. CAU 1639]MCK7614769.1 transporter substrate-binding domain-containing protein [Roseibium sp. CAU 1639]
MQYARLHVSAVLAAISLVLSPSAGLARELVFAADRWCPANCDPASDRPGYMVEIVKAVFEPLGHTVTYVELNWPRAKLYTLEGRFDGIFAAWPEGEPRFVYPQLSHGVSANGLFVHRDSDWTYEGPQSFQGQTAGLIVDYSYGEEFERAIQHYGRASYVAGDNALELNLNKLALNRLDLVVEDVNVFRYTAMSMGLNDRFRLAAAVEADDIYIAFSPQAPDAKTLAEELDTGMRRLRTSGELDRILARYGLADWQGAPDPLQTPAN